MIRRSILPATFLSFFWLSFISLFLSYAALGQSLTAGTVSGTITDPNNAVVPNASVTIQNAVTGYTQTAKNWNRWNLSFQQRAFQ